MQKLNPRATELDSQRPLLKSDSWTNNGCNIYILIALNLIKRSSLFFFSFHFNINLTFLYFTTKFIKQISPQSSFLLVFEASCNVPNSSLDSNFEHKICDRMKFFNIQ